MFFDIQKYANFKSVFNILYIEIKQKCFKKFPLDKIDSTKTPSRFFRELQLITVLYLICDSYMS